MRYFPHFVDTRQARVLVVGGGDAALAKVRLLARSEATVEIVAERLSPALDGLVSHGAVAWRARVFEDDLLDGISFVYSAAGGDIDARVAAAARRRNIPVNVVDRSDLSTFITPAIVDRDPLVVAIGSEGTGPVLAQGVRQRIEALLPPALGALALRAQALRAAVAAALPSGAARRGFWQSFFFGALRDRLIGASPAHDRQAVAAHLAASGSTSGRVVLVGAGPGDPDLITLKAQRALMEADVIVHDGAVAAAVLDHARRDARLVALEDTPGPAAESQVVALMIGEASAGRQVVRLRAGPLTFGRGEEEIEALEAAGVAVEVVPGVASVRGRRPRIALPERAAS
jgi:uroporphyrin-III C-methyltransferase/precorrin-2 dehydrogenase/sirohydrochlorin ferrochelatase